MRNPGCVLKFLVSVFIILCLGLPTAVSGPEDSEAALPQWKGNFAEGWAQYEKLQKDQKHADAAALLEDMLQRARTEKNSIEWTRCLVRKTFSPITRPFSESTIQILRKEPWPEDPMGSSVLNLFYARSLVRYDRDNFQAVSKRQKTGATGASDLTTWTRDQIYAEALKALENVWKNRDRIGESSNSSWGEFIIPNTYPAGIRPTLRDAASYLMAETMVDTIVWDSGKLTGISRLDPKKLTGNSVRKISLADPNAHPLEKICVVLSDLENWHIRQKNREAALEARLERYRYLHHYFSESKYRSHIQDSLSNYLKPLAEIPWWAEGMARLARFVLTEDDSGLVSWKSYLQYGIDRNFIYGADPEKLLRARQIALKGKEAFPDSVGGKHCLEILKAMEGGDYSISAMRNDNAGKKSILVMHRNLEKIYFRAYAINLSKTIEEYLEEYYEHEPDKSRDANDKNRIRETDEGYDNFVEEKLETLLSDTAPTQQWEESLPATPDYRMHKTFIIPPMTEPGAYLIVASMHSDFQKTDTERRGLLFTISDLALITRRWGNNYEVTVLRGSSGKPLAGAEVMIYGYDYNNHHTQIDSKLSNERGIVLFQGEEGKEGRFLVVRAGKDITYDSQRLYFYQPDKMPECSVMFFSNRTKYQPNQRLLWKAILYQRTQERFGYRTCPGASFDVALKNNKNQIVESRRATSNEFGSASGEFIIPSVPSSGGLYLEGPGSPRFNITVEELKQTGFETRIFDPGDPLHFGRPALIGGEARYSSGRPVKTGQVRWEIRQDLYVPWWWNFSTGDYSSNWSGYRTVAGGTESIKEDGTYSFSFVPEVDKRFPGIKDIVYSYTVSVKAIDTNGETCSAERSFRMGLVSVHAAVSEERGFFLENNPITIAVRRTNLNGAPKKGSGRWSIVALKEPPRTLLPAEQPLGNSEEMKNGYRTQGDPERQRWGDVYNPDYALMQWANGPTQASGSLSHGENGEGTISIPGLPAGAYRLIYETVDEFGEKGELRKDFIVASPSLSLRLPAMLALEKTNVAAGETARILAYSGIKDQFMILEIYRDMKCIRRLELLSGKDPSVIEIPVTEEDRGGLNIALTLIRDNQFIRLQKGLTIPFENKKLKIELSGFKDRLVPGSREKWGIRVIGPEGKDTMPETEIFTYSYDGRWNINGYSFPYYPSRSPEILAIPNLGEALHVPVYPCCGPKRRPDVPALEKDRLSLGAWNRLANAFDPDISEREYFQKIDSGVTSTVGTDQGGIFVEIPLSRSGINYIDLWNRRPDPIPFPDNMESEDSKTWEYTSPGISGDFGETVFWRPHLLTDKEGSASFEFEVLDSIGAWNVCVSAFTRDLKSGSICRGIRSVSRSGIRR
jgi:alpha-2-macroglobulin